MWTWKPLRTPSPALFPRRPWSSQLRCVRELSLEELVRRTKPAVVCLRALNGSGSGFFVTETGIIATNAHVARGDSSLLAVLPDGTQLQANVVYIDPDLDFALVKATPPRQISCFLTYRWSILPWSNRANLFWSLAIPEMPCCSA